MTNLFSGSITVWSSEEISLLMAGADLSDFKTGINYPLGHFDAQDSAYIRLASAAQEGWIQVRWVEVADLNEEGEVNRDDATGLFKWLTLPDDNEAWKSYWFGHIRFGVHWREINRWLKDEFGARETDIPEVFRLQSEPEESESPSPAKLVEANSQKGLLKSKRQGNAILATLREMGYEPTGYPKQKDGHSGVKADVRGKLLTSRRDLFTEKSFDNAWQRLRNEGHIHEK